MTRQNRNAASQLSTGNKEAVGLATDYIRCLSEHLRYILSRTVSERDLKSIAFNFVVTVPTMWTEVAKDKTRIACMQALDAFGSSVYLRERIFAAFGGGIEVMQPPNAWQAVVKGAVMKGLIRNDPSSFPGVRVTARKARKSYGLSLASDFDIHKHAHLASKKRWDLRSRSYKVDHMNWFIKRVGRTSPKQSTSLHTYALLLEPGHLRL